MIELLITIMMLAFLAGMLLPAQNTSDVNCINDASSNDINSVADQYDPGAELIGARSHPGRHVYVLAGGHIEVHHPLSTISPQGGPI